MNEARASILVVDDEEPIRGVVARRLEADGYRCVVAADGKEALWKSFMEDFDLILTDIKMPGMSGMDVLNQITKDHPDTSVIMITALADTQTAVEAMKLGAQDYVTKPFNLDDLVIRVDRALEKRRLVLENREYQLHLEQKVERQLGQIKQYYREAIEALAREEVALAELGALRGTGQPKHAKDTGKSDSDESSGSIKGFARKISHLISSAGPDSAPEQRTVEPEQAEGEVDEAAGPASTGHKEAGEQLAPSGSQPIVELVVVPPVNLNRILRLHERLRKHPQIHVLNLGGSVDKGITVRLEAEAAELVLKVVGDAPEVKRVSEDGDEIERTVPGRRGENPPVKRILIEVPREVGTEAVAQSEEEP